jgi:hypothetical protein
MNYQIHDRGLSLHGLHIKESERMLSNGITRGMPRARVDDHCMLKSEMHWDLPSRLEILIGGKA